MDDDRKKIRDFKEGSSVVEVWEKYDNHSDRVFYDIKICREYEVEGEVRRGVMLQHRDLLDAQIAIIRAHKHISSLLRGIRVASRYRDDRETSDAHIEPIKEEKSDLLYKEPD